MITGFILLGMVSFAEAQEPIKGDSLQEVVVTGTGTHHLLRTAPVQTEVITRRDLEQYGGRSIEEILNGLSASFSFNEDDMGSQMQMNGLGNSYILALSISLHESRKAIFSWKTKRVADRMAIFVNIMLWDLHSALFAA